MSKKKRKTGNKLEVAMRLAKENGMSYAKLQKNESLGLLRITDDTLKIKGVHYENYRGNT